MENELQKNTSKLNYFGLKKDHNYD